MLFVYIGDICDICTGHTQSPCPVNSMMWGYEGRTVSPERCTNCTHDQPLANWGVLRGRTWPPGPHPGVEFLAISCKLRGGLCKATELIQSMQIRRWWVGSRTRPLSCLTYQRSRNSISPRCDRTFAIIFIHAHSPHSPYRIQILPGHPSVCVSRLESPSLLSIMPSQTPTSPTKAQKPKKVVVCISSSIYSPFLTKRVFR